MSYFFRFFNQSVILVTFLANIVSWLDHMDLFVTWISLSRGSFCSVFLVHLTFDSTDSHGNRMVELSDVNYTKTAF